MAQSCEVPSRPLVSIVLPTYNGARYLRRAVHSCLDQDYIRFELIIVDDASTDDTPTIIAEVAGQDSRVRSIRHARNRKLPAALNTGFDAARGDYLTWTSDDNAYRPYALTEMVEALQRHPHIGIVYADATYIDENDQAMRLMPAQLPEMLAFNNPIGACFLYRRCVHEKLAGYAEDLFLAEDYDFWLRASCHFALQPIHKDLYLYRWHAQSLTLQRKQDVRLAAEEALRRNLPHMTWLGSALRADAFLELARAAKRRDDRRRTRDYCLQAFRCSPSRVLRQAREWLARRADARRAAV